MIDAMNAPTPIVGAKFSTKIPKLQLVWSPHSIDALQHCAWYYEQTIINGYTSPFENSHLRFGREFHAAMQSYDLLRASGVNHELAQLRVLRETLVSTWDSERGRPWMSEEPAKTRNTLLRTIVLYTDRYADDNLHTIIAPDGTPWVEQERFFNLGAVTTSNEEFILRARLDRAVAWNGESWITDYKTTKKALDDHFFEDFSPDNQVSALSIIGSVTIPGGVGGVIVDAMQLLVGGTRFRRREIPRSPEQNEEWLNDLIEWLKLAESYALDQYWPRNRKHCKFCDLRKICTAEPAIRQTLLDATFIRTDRPDDSFR